MDLSVESLCNQLARSKLASPDEVRSLYQRWAREAGPAAADVQKFASWLAGRNVATEYQLGFVMRGHADQLFLGPYTILERVGKGRMAGVYKAVHRLGQVVAIKILPPSKSRDPKTLARFRREARLSIRLKHPNVVRTYQAGVAGNLNYLVMEYLEGETLQELLQRRGKLPPAEAVRVVHQALLGLQHVFEQGLIHRDLKPGNLMLLPGHGPKTDADTCKLMDIGTGRDLFDEGGGGDFNLTQSSDVLGTPEYMAPEQARDARSADIRSDVYSLGCVLYHCLAGRPPFTSSNTVRLLVMHATEPVRPVRELAPQVPEGLEQILGWMLAKDPGQRYATPGRAAQALEVFLAAGGPGEAPADPKLDAYLDWLEAQPGDPEDVDVELVPVPVAPPAPLATPVGPLPLPRVEVDEEAPPRPAKKPRPPQKKQEPQPRPAAAPPKPRRRAKEREEEEEDEEPAGKGSARMWLLIAAIVGGVILVLCAGGVGTVALLWFRS